MIESQAIARVLRIGQDRDVKVIRYIVKGSVEEARALYSSFFNNANWYLDDAVSAVEETGIC